MTDAELARAPTAHVSTTFGTDYADVDADTHRSPTAHVSATLSTTEPGA